MYSYSALLLGFIFLTHSAFAQVGGKTSYQFLNMPVNAHVAGVGGINISVRDQDPNMVMQNPALLNESMHNYFSVSYLPLYGNVKASSLAYVRKYRKNMLGASLQYLGYGNLQHTDASGNILGTFNAREFVLNLSAAHTINHYTIGGNLKLADSYIYTYNSTAILADVAALFKHPDKELSIALAIKNMGLPISNYVKGQRTVLPFDVQLGTTYKPEHMPLRFSFTAHHLHQFDIVYLDTTIKNYDLQGNQIIKKKSVGDKIGRHLIVGGELILSKNFHVRIGYNYQRRREMRTTVKAGGAGFSWGFMMRVKSFELGFTRAYYYAAGGTSFLTLTTNFGTIIKKKEPSLNNPNQN
jgi:hypothetical protein